MAEAGVEVFPKWLKSACFAGRKTKSHAAAQLGLVENGIVIINWGGGRKSWPDAVFLDRETACKPPKKVEIAKEIGMRIIDVEWVCRCLKAQAPQDWKDEYDLSHLLQDSESDEESAGESVASAESCSMSFSDSEKGCQKASPFKARRKRHVLMSDSDSDSDNGDIQTLCNASSSSNLKSLRMKVSDAPWWERGRAQASDKPQWVGVGIAPATTTAPTGRRSLSARHSVGAAAATSTAPTTSASELAKKRAQFAQRRSRSSKATPSDPLNNSVSGNSASSSTQAKERVNHPVSHQAQSRSRSTGPRTGLQDKEPIKQRQVAPVQKPVARQPLRTVAPAAANTANNQASIVDKAAEKRKARTDYSKPWQAGSKKAKDEKEKEKGEAQQDPIMKALKEHEATKGVSPEMLQTIRNEILDPETLKQQGLTFKDVHGLEEAKKTLHRSVILPRLNPKLFQGLRKPAKGLLLFGPPGNGKTMLAKAVAAQCNLTFFNISASVLTSKMVGDGEKNVKALFACARALAPSFVFLDEIDSLLTARGGGGSEHEASRRLKTEFLVQLDGAGATNDQVLVMAATNRPMDLDDAILRRMEKRVYVPLPNKDTRLQYCRTALQKDENLNIDFTAETWDTLATATEDYSFCDLANLCRELALAPLDDVTDLLEADVSDLRPINEADVATQVMKIRKSVSLELLKQLVAWNEKFGSQSDAK